MKPIELTESHKEKLLEMCNTLWKKEEWRFSLDVPGNLNKNHIFIMGFIGDNDYIPNCDCYIHWFEFCLMHLPYKIFGTQYNEQLIHSKFQCLVDEHIIDYLYEKFKKLKK